MKKIVIIIGLLSALSLSACSDFNPKESTLISSEVKPDCEEGQDHLPNSYADHEKSGEICAPDPEASEGKKQSFQNVKTICQEDIAKLCGDLPCKELMKPTQVCLMMDGKLLSPDCKKALNQHIGEHQTGIRPLD